jgi:hypothetical protein
VKVSGFRMSKLRLVMGVWYFLLASEFAKGLLMLMVFLGYFSYVALLPWAGGFVAIFLGLWTCIIYLGKGKLWARNVLAVLSLPLLFLLSWQMRAALLSDNPSLAGLAALELLSTFWAGTLLLQPSLGQEMAQRRQESESLDVAEDLRSV